MLELDEVFEHPQVRCRGMLVEQEHPNEGLIKSIGVTPKLSHNPGRITRAAPVLGQHTEEVLRSLGFGDSEVERLRATGVI